MRRTTLALILSLAACGGPPAPDTGRIPEGSPSRAFDPDGDGAAEGTQFDTDGDGKFDAVDTDGDGLLDGGDFDGDGVVTLFDKLGTGGAMPSEEQLASFAEDVDPDFEQQLAGLDEPADGAGAVATRPAVDLSGFLPRPVNQGALGSCAAFTVAAIATAARAQRMGVDPNTVWASPQFLYARQLKAGNFKCDNGTYIHDGLATLVVEGSTPLAQLPYSDTMCAMEPAAQDANDYRIGAFEVLHPFTRDKVKEALSKGSPIAFGVSLPPNFGKWGGAQAKQVFKSDNGQLDNKHGGGHAMVLVGHDDARGAYRILNSWGSDWGDGGYLWWDYADLEGREGLHGFAIASYREPPPALVSVTEASLELGAVAAIAVRTKTGDRLVAHVKSNAALVILSAALDDQPAVQREQFLAAGNVSVHASGTMTPGPHKITLSGRIASGLTHEAAKTQGAPFTRTLMVTVGEPLSDPDGLL